MPPKKKGSKERTNYAALKKRYLAHEFETIEEMSEKLPIPLGTIYKHSGGWEGERKELDATVEEEVKEIIVQDQATRLQSMLNRQIEIAEKLQIKAHNRLFGKVKDKHGNYVEREFDDDGLAMMSLRFTGATLGQLMRRRGGDDGEGSGGTQGPVFDIDDDSMTPAKKKEKLTLYSPDQLRLIIGDKDAGNSRAKKGRG